MTRKQIRDHLAERLGKLLPDLTIYGTRIALDADQLPALCIWLEHWSPQAGDFDEHQVIGTVHLEIMMQAVTDLDDRLDAVGDVIEADLSQDINETLGGLVESLDTAGGRYGRDGELPYGTLDLQYQLTW